MTSHAAPRRLHWLLLISAVIVIARPPHQDHGCLAHPLRRSHPRHPQFSAHHALAQRRRSLLALRRFRIAARRSLGPHRILSAVAALAVFIAMFRLGSQFTLATFALALVLGGALGNLYDRIAYGSVVDFIEVHIFRYHWPDFNVADSSIVTGACLLLLDSLLRKEEESPSASNEPANRC